MIETIATTPEWPKRLETSAKPRAWEGGVPVGLKQR
jgi:hypothetical protein